jgi:tetratricopeptide (TPR) repeat protein
MVYGTCALMDYPVEGALEASEREAERALALDPSLGSVHAALGALCALRGRWIEAEAAFRTAAPLTTDYPAHLLRVVYLDSSVGHIRGALRSAEEGARLAGHEPFQPNIMAMVLLVLGRDEEARRHLDRSVELGQPRTVTPTPDMYAQLAFRAGRPEDAAVDLAPALPPAVAAAGGADAVYALCRALAGGDKPAVAAQLKTVAGRVGPEALDQPIRKRLILWYTLLGDLDAAFESATASLEHYARSGTIGGAWGVLWLAEMLPFRCDARFVPLAERMGLVDYWDVYGPPDGEVHPALLRKGASARVDR